MPYEAGNYRIQYQPLSSEDEERRELELALSPVGQARRKAMYGVGAGAGALLGAASAARLVGGRVAPSLAGLAGGLLGAGAFYAAEGRHPLPVQTRLVLPSDASSSDAEEAASIARIAGFDLPDLVPSRRTSFQLAYGYDPGEPVVTKVSTILARAARPGGFLDRLRAHSASLRAY